MNSNTAVVRNIHDIHFAGMVDQLGYIKSQIAELKAQEDALKAKLIAAGGPVIEGNLYRAAVCHVDARPVIDWKAIAEHLNPSRQLVVAHTTYSEPYVAVRLSARKTA